MAGNRQQSKKRDGGPSSAVPGQEVSWVRVEPPVGWRWDHAALPFTVHRQGTGKGSRYKLDADPRALIPVGLWNAPIATAWFHVDPINGNDTTGTGLSPTAIGDFSTAVKTGSKAIALGNALGAPYWIVVPKGAMLNRDTGLHGLGGTVMATQDVGVIAVGPGTGRATMASKDALTWLDEGSGQGLWKVTKTGRRIFDTVNQKTYTCLDGRTVQNYTEFVKVADAAAVVASVAAGVSAWAQVSGDVIAKRADGLPINDANTRLYINTPCCRWDTTTKNVYLNGIDFEGGSTQCLESAVGAVSRNFVAENCSFKYPGDYASTGGNCVGFASMDGTAALINCEMGLAPTDGINGHYAPSTGRFQFFTVGCRVFDVGKPTLSSCNAWTLHEYCTGFDFGGEYGFSTGGTIGTEVGTTVWSVGSYFHDDRRDVNSKREEVSTNGRIWTDGVRIKAGEGPTGRAMSGVGTGWVLYRNPVDIVGISVATGTSVVGPYDF